MTTVAGSYFGGACSTPLTRVSQGTRSRSTPGPEQSILKVWETTPFVGAVDIDPQGRISYADEAGLAMFQPGGDGAPEVSVSAEEGTLFSSLVGEKFACAIERSLDPEQPKLLRAIVEGSQIVMTASMHQSDSGFSLVAHHRPNVLPRFIKGFEVRFLGCGSFGRLDTLSSREIEVAAWIGMGLSVRSIGEHLHRSIKTIENHRVAIGKKLRVRDRLEIAMLAFQAGLRPEDIALERL